MHGQLVVVEDVPGEFSRRVIEAFQAAGEDGASIALSGGETARRCYERLAAESAEVVDWFSVDVYWGDERCVPPDHEASNERLGREALLERVGAARTVHPMRCEDGADRYQLVLAEAGAIDVIHLGLGADGHTASLFPGSPALEAESGRLVVMNEDHTGRNPHPRMTFTLEAIARGRLVLVTVTGAEKRDALAAVVSGGDVPAAKIRGDRVVWIADPAAAGA